MNEKLAAVLQLAAMRDALVTKLFIGAAVLLLSYGALRAASIPPAIRDFVLGLQMFFFMALWFGLLLGFLLGLHE